MSFIEQTMRAFVEIGAIIFTERLCELIGAHRCGPQEFVYFA